MSEFLRTVSLCRTQWWTRSLRDHTLGTSQNSRGCYCTTTLSEEIHAEIIIVARRIVVDVGNRGTRTVHRRRRERRGGRGVGGEPFLDPRGRPRRTGTTTSRAGPSPSRAPGMKVSAPPISSEADIQKSRVADADSHQGASRARSSKLPFLGGLGLHLKDSYLW